MADTIMSMLSSCWQLSTSIVHLMLSYVMTSWNDLLGADRMVACNISLSTFIGMYRMRLPGSSTRTCTISSSRLSRRSYCCSLNHDCFWPSSDLTTFRMRLMRVSTMRSTDNRYHLVAVSIPIGMAADATALSVP